ncbi:MAG: alpha/beta hydrolase-fold protein [Bacteroidota bacterium]
MSAINSSANSLAVINIFSKVLQHEFIVNVLFPPMYKYTTERFKVLYLNDGQDLQQLQLKETLDRLYAENKIEHIIIVAINTVERMLEYGIASRPDYLERGSMASGYSRFITSELMPFINYHYRTLTGADYTAFAGFSLGALSALDIVWNHPYQFGKAGVFSGSLWWRKKDLKDDYKDSDRIMHDKIRRSKKRDGIKFWFQTGTLDETDDRNNNGVIDSIDDTLDLIHELKKKGFVTFLANTLIKNENTNTANNKQVNFTRDTTKSFFNLVWKTVFTGVKNTAIGKK